MRTINTQHFRSIEIKQIPGLAIEHFAQFRQRFEANPFHLSGPEKRQVRLADTNGGSDFFCFHALGGKHGIKRNDDLHVRKYLPIPAA